jgi:hypothetical protein
MNESQLTHALLIGYTIEVAVAVFAYLRLVHIYRREHGHRSLLWRGLLWIFGICVAVGIGLVPVGLTALFDLPRLPLTGAAVSLGVMILLGAVIGFWLVVERVRKRHPIIEPEPDTELNDQATHTTTEEPGR